jgi:hypothetical protein
MLSVVFVVRAHALLRKLWSLLPWTYKAAHVSNLQLTAR